jgi:alpha-tubulin suppressor-like RCC1 family protein
VGDTATTASKLIAAEDCLAGSINGKVGICHATGSTTKSYVHIRVSTNGCINGHAQHPGDFISDDPGCAVCTPTTCDIHGAECGTIPDGCGGMLDCGSCNVANGSPLCSDGKCSVGSCNAGYANCNAADSDGCETNVATDASNCGDCAFTCASGSRCIGGSCVAGSVVAVAAGSTHTCALLSDGTIRCWGLSNVGQLGNGSAIIDPVTTPVMVSGITKAIAIAAHGSHTCAVLDDGTVRCWGDGFQLPVTVSGIPDAIAVGAGWGHTCAVLSGGTLQCWGWNYYGQLGDGTTTNSSVPVSVPGITNAIAVSGHTHTCALLSDGMISCWGQNVGGALGNGTTIDSLVPTTVSGITNAVAVGAGDAYTCAVLSGGTVQCWGFNYGGCLGIPGDQINPLPLSVPSITNAIAIAAGGSHTCVLLEHGTMQCWGLYAQGQLGNGAFPSGISNISTVPVPVSGITNAIAISAGSNHTCAVLSEGTLQCWGWNDYGQLGNGTTTSSAVPVTVTGF